MARLLIERYFASPCFTSALKAVGQSRQVVARGGLDPHFEMYTEIHLIMDGAVDWWVEDERYSLPPGTVYITKPGELHGGVRSLVQPCSLTWLQIDANALDDVEMAAELRHLPRRQWSGAQELSGYIQAILQECRHPQPDSRRLVNGYLHLFVAQLLRLSARRAVTPVYPPRFAALLSYIDGRLLEDTPITVQELCGQANLSRSRLFQLFNQHLGQSPISYINAHKIETAKIHLRQTDMPITLVALKLGYATSQHFATVFKRITGVTPSEFRRSTKYEIRNTIGSHS